jgi:hypothetical protein
MVGLESEVNDADASHDPCQSDGTRQVPVGIGEILFVVKFATGSMLYL